MAEALAEAGVRAQPVAVRMLSSIESTSQAQQLMLQRQWSSGEAYPSEFPYRSRAIMLFQRVRGLEVNFFTMYTQVICPSAPNAPKPQCPNA